MQRILIRVIALVLVFVCVTASLATAGGRGMVRTGKRGIFDGTADIVTKRGNTIQGRYTTVGKGVPKGTGAALARDFGFQELVHGPRDDRTVMERAMDQYSQRPYTPYSGSDLAPRQSYDEYDDDEDCGDGYGYYAPPMSYQRQPVYSRPAAYGSSTPAPDSLYARSIIITDESGRPVAVITGDSRAVQAAQ